MNEKVIGPAFRKKNEFSLVLTVSMYTSNFINNKNVKLTNLITFKIHTII